MKLLEKAAELEDWKKWREGAKTREVYAATRAAQNVTALADQEKMAHDLIEAGYRALAKKYHPDTGGTDEQFRLLKDAKALLESRIFSKRDI